MSDEQDSDDDRRLELEKLDKTLPWVQKYDVTKMDYLDFAKYFIYEIFFDDGDSWDEGTKDWSYEPVGDFDSWDEMYTGGFLHFLVRTDADYLYDASRKEYFLRDEGWVSELSEYYSEDNVIQCFYELLKTEELLALAKEKGLDASWWFSNQKPSRRDLIEILEYAEEKERNPWTCLDIPSAEEIKNGLEKEKFFEFVFDDRKLVILSK